MNLKLHKFLVLLRNSTWNTFYCLNNYTQILKLITSYDSCVIWNVTVYQNNSLRRLLCYLQNSIFFMSCGLNSLVICNKINHRKFRKKHEVLLLYQKSKHRHERRTVARRELLYTTAWGVVSNGYGLYTLNWFQYTKYFSISWLKSIQLNLSVCILKV